MEGKPVLSPRFPRFAPPRPGLCRSNSRSPTRPSKLADDILSDLSPATTLEAFTNPSGKLKASIEAATPSERAFGLRATLASNKIQEWVEELSGWPWPAEGGSAGFEMPVTERRRPSTQDGDQEARRNSNHGSEHNQEPKYIGSLLSTEVERYENRIDDIAMDMEDLDVEAIKRRVLDTHFSPRSRPSSSGSNASPMSSLFASYIRMDDFTAVITATVLQSLPILSKLTRLMENWNVRLTVLRHIPPLVWALDDAEVALKSGWATIGTPEQSPAGKEQQPHLSYLTRETFEIMRGVLQEKVTRLGQDLDFLLDTLEGRQDTLPEAWLDRMETLENDYGLWVVSGDRKVREGEWARMAKARQEEEDARKLREAEAAETARRNAEQEAEEAARKRAEKGAEEAEVARLKAEYEAEEAARLQASRLAQEAEAARHKAEQEAREAAQQRALRGAEAAKIIAEDEARESARIQALKSRDEAAQSRADEETLEAAKQKAVPVAQGAERAQLLGERESDEAAERKAHAMEQSKIQAQQDFADAVSHKLKNDAESAEAQRKELSEATRQRGLLLAEALLVSKRKADQERTAQKMAQLRTEMLTVDTTGAEDTDQRQAAAQKTRDERSSEFIPTTISSAGAESPQHPDIDCDICVELQQGETPSPLQAPASVTGSAVSSPSIQTQDSVCSLAACDMDGAAKPRISQYAPFDGGYEESDPAIRETQVEIFSNDMITSPGLASPVNLDDSFPQTPTSMLSTSAEVFTSPTSESSIPSPNAKVSRFENAFPSYTRGTSHEKKISDANSTTSIRASGTPVRSPVFTDGANDQSDSGESAIQTATNHGDIAVESPTYEILHSADAQGPQSDRERSSSSTSADIISSSPELTTELRGAQYPEDFPSPASFAGSPDASAHDSAPTTASMFLPSIPTTSNPPGTDIRTPPKSRASFEQSLSWDDSCISVLSPVAEEKMPACTELQNVDGPCEPCELAIRELTPNEDNHLNDIPILGRMIPTPRTDSSAEDGSVSSPKGVAKVTFYGTAGPGYSISVPLDGTSTQTNDALPITYVSCETVNLKEECILDTVENPPALVALSPGMWMVVPPQTVTSISLTGGSPVKPASNGSPGTGLSRRESLSSDASTVINGRVSESPCSPIISPISEDVSELFEDNEPSPSAGRKGQRAGNFYDMSPSGSPPGKLQRPPLNFPKRAPATPSSSTAPATPLATFATPLEAPFFDNIDLSTTPMMNSPKKANSDEQMQQQISSLLESIPARIRLSTEVESTPVVPQTVRTKRSQRSLTPSFRPSSSMSNCSTSRAPTPSFTLAPAYGKPGSRHRPQSNNPEIKLYHLSRSTSEAPIKLFVRLVGEHGERVMVRVGGGWADLGEYLKEYASHHGRRSTVEVSDKVEIQDLPARNVSSSSIATIRNGRASPVPSRPQSVLERERSASASGLRVRKTRRSLGEFSSSSDSVGPARISGARCPSTPIPSTSRAQSQHHDSPPSAASSVDTGRSSRLSWTDEDFSLGLAGPKSKRVVISERDQEWVDSMKEKVKMASAEKEKRERGSTTKAGNAKVEGKESFGEMEKIRGTKRLFMKSGN